MLGCGVAIFEPTEPQLAAIEAEYCYLPEVQISLTARYLSDAVDHLAPGVVRELVEPLGTVVTIFRFGDRTALIGPYLHASRQLGETESLLAELRIPAGRLHAVALYLARFAIVDSEYVMRGAAALLDAGGLASQALTYERIEVSAARQEIDWAEPTHSADFQVIEARYSLESEFMHAVAEGNEDRALATMLRMQETPKSPRYFTTNPYVGATAMRIMTRIAAQRGGLPPVTIDAISQSYAQRLHRSGRNPDTQQATRAIAAMVSDFCRHIRRFRRRPYSGLVRRVMDEVDLHPSNAITTRELARRLGISQSQLARRFKAETGGTVTEYVTASRTARAAQLLISTSQPINEVAANVGYLDANYFVKIFRREYGMTPSRYRQEHGA